MLTFWILTDGALWLASFVQLQQLDALDGDVNDVVDGPFADSRAVLLREHDSVTDAEAWICHERPNRQKPVDEEHEDGGSHRRSRGEDRLAWHLLGRTRRLGQVGRLRHRQSDAE